MDSHSFLRIGTLPAYVTTFRTVEPKSEETQMPKPVVTRREFTLALAGSAALAADQASAIGQDVTPKKADSKPPAADKSGTDAKRAKDEPGEKVEAGEPPPEAAYLLGLIMRRYPDKRLDEAAVSGIVRDIYGDVARSRVLSSFPLDNSDEPGFTFKAWRAD
ncbi:MAG: hypothetical protein ACI92S_002505 [Planctomycetaceae bacterium]